MRTFPEQFQALCEEFAEHEHALLGFKAEEYASTTDRLLNFRQIAAFEERTMPQIAMTYLLKHLQSINMAVQKGDTPKWCWINPGGGEGLKQRFADARNYLLLLAACIEEQFRQIFSEQEVTDDSDRRLDRGADRSL